MSTFRANDAEKAVLATILAGYFLIAGACSPRSEHTQSHIPLWVTAGPDDFTSFEMRSPQGETLWRLEARTPSALPFVVYAVVPEGFRQTLPTTGAPRPLRLGEDLILESRIPNRILLHRAFARSDSTITILESEMRRLEPRLEAPGNPLR